MAARPGQDAHGVRLGFTSPPAAYEFYQGEQGMIRPRSRTPLGVGHDEDQVFERMETLRGYVATTSRAATGTFASADGDTGTRRRSRFMGDWAKARVPQRGRDAERGLCSASVPGHPGARCVQLRPFRALRGWARIAREAQNALATATLSPEFQSAFNVVRDRSPAAHGRLPRRVRRLRADGHDGSLGGQRGGHAPRTTWRTAPQYTPAVENAMYDVDTRHFNGPHARKRPTRPPPALAKSGSRPAQ